jgi:hypothetical protein
LQNRREGWKATAHADSMNAFLHHSRMKRTPRHPFFIYLSDTSIKKKRLGFTSNMLMAMGAFGADDLEGRVDRS